MGTHAPHRSDGFTHTFVPLAAAILSCACAAPEPAPLLDAGNVPALQRQIDLLVVADNSSSTDELRDTLAMHLPALLDALGKDAADLPDLRLGVVTADLGAGPYRLGTCERVGGDGGKLRPPASRQGCPKLEAPYVELVAGKSNVPGPEPELEKLAQAFRCQLALGNGGCEFEQPLEAARRALDPARRVNPGFLRPGALLAVLFVTDEDDCSAAKTELYRPVPAGLTDPLGPLSGFRCFEFGIWCDVNDRSKIGPRHGCRPVGDWLVAIAEYESFFRQLKPPGRLLLAAVAGPPEPVEVGLDVTEPTLLPSTGRCFEGGALPAIRIHALLERFPPLLFAPKCVRGQLSGDYRPLLSSLGNALRSRLPPSRPAL
ncbi:MAG: hypothetical protein IT371_29285 [Deltaproteobacteria bacterium]|nr:hypothetical protein [Deltaproteobacteria bacterium]